MIIYVTGRPDMQKHRVVAWLTQHNFPHGIVSFCDGLTHDPLRQKAVFLQGLQQEVCKHFLHRHRLFEKDHSTIGEVQKRIMILV